MDIKRILCLIFALCLMVSVLGACGGKDEKPADTTVSNDSGDSSDTVTAFDPDMTDVDDKYKNNWDPYASMPDECKGVTVRYAFWHNMMEDIGGVPMANSKNDIGIDVEMFMVEQGGYVSTLMTKIASGDIPDIFVSNEGDQAFPLTLQIAAPINKVTTMDLNDPKWDKTMLAAATIEGNVYLVNAVASPVASSNLVFYNKRLFEENGFKTPEEYYAEGTWSWDNMLKCAKDVKTLGSDYTGIYIEMDILAGTVGASVVKYDYKSHMFSNGTSDPNLLKAYQWYADAKEQGYLDGSLSSFTQGKSAIYVRGVYGLQAKGYFMNMDPDDIGFTYLPGFDQNKGRISSIFGMHGIVDKAPNANAAGYFLRYYMDYENYDLDNVFLNVDAGNFYYELVNAGADAKYFNFDAPVATLIGQNANSAFYNEIKSVSSAGIRTALDSISNVVDEAVSEANALVNGKIEADLNYYK